MRWYRLKKKAKWGHLMRTKYYKQQKNLRDEGLTVANEGWNEWVPDHVRFSEQGYYGPESHPDNPDFPSTSPGYGRALVAWTPAKLGATTAKGGGRSKFAGGLKFAMTRRSRGAGSALVLHAHKKAASSTKNQGHELNPKHYGPTKRSGPGAAVKTGTILARQKGLHYYPGANVKLSRNYSLVALKDGIVQWKGTEKHYEIS